MVQIERKTNRTSTQQNPENRIFRISTGTHVNLKQNHYLHLLAILCTRQTIVVDNPRYATQLPLIDKVICINMPV